jgi:alpha-galactosidase
MSTSAAIDASAGVWRAVMRIPFAAFEVTPTAGDRWHVNLFRVARLHGVRQFLAYAPTDTATPDFHVPDRFVPLVFAAAEPS